MSIIMDYRDINLDGVIKEVLAARAATNDKGLAVGDMATCFVRKVDAAERPCRVNNSTDVSDYQEWKEDDDRERLLSLKPWG